MKKETSKKKGNWSRHVCDSAVFTDFMTIVKRCPREKLPSENMCGNTVVPMHDAFTLLPYLYFIMYTTYVKSRNMGNDIRFKDKAAAV